MKKFASSFGISLILVMIMGFFLAIAPTFARSTGRAGKYGGTSGSCSDCHSGGVAPTVTLSGPTDLTPGQVVDYQLMIQSNNIGVQTHAGLNVAVVDATETKVGTLVIGGTDTQILLEEIAHTEPKQAESSGLTTFSFSYIAPTTPGEYTIYYAGNSVDFLGSTSGDQVGLGTTKINVSAPSAVELQQSTTKTNDTVIILSVLVVLGVVATIGASRHFGQEG